VWEARERYEATYGVTEDFPEVERRRDPAENPFDPEDA